MLEPAEGHDRVIGTEPCPKCGSVDNMKRYADGHAYCFSPGCKHREAASGGEGAQRQPVRAAASGLLEPAGPASWKDWRGLRIATLKRFGFFFAKFSGQTVAVGPNYDQAGELVNQKVRFSTKKDFTTLAAEGAPSLSKCQLFGQHVFGQRYDRKVVVTEGYEDAMSVAQATDFKVAAYSVTTGAEGALRNVKENFAELDRFSEIIFWFDDDEPGRNAAHQCAQLFDIGKVKIAKAPGFKDANEALKAGKPGDVEAAIYMAVTWKPQGIVNAEAGFQQMYDEGFQVPSWPYPWAMLNERSLGMRRTEISYHVAGTGVAKTTLLYHMAVHLLAGWDGQKFQGDNPVEQPPKIGWIGFEDSTRSVKLGMLSIHAGQRLHLHPVPKDVAAKLYQELFGSGRLELYDPQEAEYGLEAFWGYVKLMAKALGCHILVVDPLSELIASLPIRDRTAAEDQVASGFQRMAKTLNICIHIAYHLRKPDGTAFEAGGEIGIPDIKGSGALTHFSSNVFAYERDQQGSRPDLLRIRALKLRFTGLTGEVGLLKYDPLTGRYSPTKDRWPDKNSDTGGFGPPQQDQSFGQDF